MKTKHTPAPLVNSLIPSDSEVLNEINNRLKGKRLDTEEEIVRAVWYQNGFEEAIKWLRSSKKLNQYSAAPELLEALQQVRYYMTAHTPEKIFDLVDNAIKKATE